MLLKGKNVIISGATRGIGKAIALEFAHEGANISFSFLKSEKEAIAFENEIKSLGVKVRAFKLDIQDFPAVSTWFLDTMDLFGGVDIVVNNAGIIKDKALALMELEDWQSVINTNLGGVFNLTRSAIVTLLKQKSGNIINISSISGITGVGRQTNYSASKAAIIGFTKSLAREVAPYNIRVNAIAPGFIDTDMLIDLNPDLKEKILKRIPLARLGKAEEVAKAAKFLASDASGYVTGQTIIVDGGLSLA